jgi:hypothetical protein
MGDELDSASAIERCGLPNLEADYRSRSTFGGLLNHGCGLSWTGGSKRLRRRLLRNDPFALQLSPERFRDPG